MFEYIKGTLINIDPIQAIVEANGIGYKLFIPINAYSEAIPGKEILLYTSYIVREDAHILYGFFSIEERDLFESLRSVNGIGPKTAICLIGHLGISNFQQAIIENDFRIICKVPGIGKKTAERLIIEMKDKHKLFEKLSSAKSNKNNSNPAVSDAIRALINLGYHPIKARKAVDIASKENNTDNPAILISLALSKI